jgi:hypothetical protein
MPTTLTQAEAAQHLERAFNEAQRLQVRSSQRSQAEKKMLSVLQRVVPKLKRLARGSATKEDAVKPDELAVLETLKPAAKAS